MLAVGSLPEEREAIFRKLTISAKSVNGWDSATVYVLEMAYGEIASSKAGSREQMREIINTYLRENGLKTI